LVTTVATSERTRSWQGPDDNVDPERDRELVARAQAGDRAAFDDLYMRYYKRLFRFCVRRLHDSHEAEDVTQEAFSRAWRALSTFDGARSFYPWLSVIAAHLCTDVWRRRRRSTPVAEFHQKNIASCEDGGEELMIAAVDSQLVARAFERLSERHQRVLRLREGSEWSYQEIADHEGLATTAVETLLWRARQALRREFAMLVRAEDRTAAWIGSALSLAALRRLLRLPVRAIRRVAAIGHNGGGGALAMGSAAAAAAVVVASALSAPTSLTPTQVAQPNGITTVAGQASNASGSSPVLSGQSAGPVATPGSSAAQTNDDPVSPSAAALGNTSGSDAGSSGPAGNDGNLAGASGSSLLSGIPAPDIESAVTNAISSTVGSVGGVVSAVAGTVGGALGALGSIGQLPLGAVAGLGSSVVGQATTTVSNAVQGAITGSDGASGLGAVLGPIAPQAPATSSSAGIAPADGAGSVTGGLAGIGGLAGNLITP